MAGLILTGDTALVAFLFIYDILLFMNFINLESKFR